MSRVLFVSLNSSNTGGHKKLIDKIIHKLRKKHKCIIASDHIIKNELVEYIQLKKQKHTYTAGGCFNYMYRKDIINIVKEKSIKTVVFSTFFDYELVRELRKLNVKTIYLSYPLRDTHLQILYARTYLNKFDLILWLKDIFPEHKLELSNEMYCSPILEDITNLKNKKNQILVTCGGAGRPSAKHFLKIIQELVSSPKMLKVQFLIVDPSETFNLKQSNISIIGWSNSLQTLINNSSLVISEAGYHTIGELIYANKPAILIPGFRRIDNQELRAVYFEKLGCGKVFLPEEDNKKFVDIVISMLSDNNFIGHPKVLKVINQYETVDKIIGEAIK